MANEIKLTPSIVYENGTIKRTYQPGTLNLPQATKGVLDQTVTATSAEADIAVASLGTPGICFMHNLESTTTGKTWLWGLKSSTGGIPTYFRLPPKQAAIVNYGTSAMVIRGKGLAAGSFQVSIVTFEN